MIRNIGILVSMLLAFHFNVGGAEYDFPRCDNITVNSQLEYGLKRQCEAEECGYDQNLETCNSYDLMYHGALAMKTGIALMIFVILLIIVSIVNMVKFN